MVEDECDYGALSENLYDCIEQGRKFYLTTAIAYTNGYPHIGIQSGFNFAAN